MIFSPRAKTVIKQIFVVVSALTIAVPAFGQTYTDSQGTIVHGMVPVPFPFTPLGPGQYGVSIATATGLTIPAGARYVNVCADGQPMRYTTDGQTTPTAGGTGVYVANGSCVLLEGPKVIANFKAITTTAGGTLDAEYFK